MSSIDFENLEAYLFAEDKQEFLSKLIPNTEPFLFFSYLYALNNSNTLSSEIEARIEDYRRKFGSSTSQNIQVRALLKKYDNPSTKPDEKVNIITKLMHEHFHFGFNFNHSKPSNIVTSTLQTTQKISNSTLDPKLIAFESHIGSVYNYHHSLNALACEAFSRLDFDKILSSNHVELQKTFAVRANPIDFEDFPKLFLEIQKKEVNYQPDFDRLTLAQLETFKSKWSQVDSRLLTSHFKKEFGGCSYTTLKQGLSRQEKRDLAFNIYNWAVKHYPSFRLLKSRALYEVLDLNIELNSHNHTLFLEYLKDPPVCYANISQTHPKYSDNTYSTPNPIDFGSERVPVDVLIKTYLEEAFKTAKDTSAYDKYFEKKHLTTLFYSTKLMLGQAPESTDVLTPEDLKSLVESKDLTICGFNPEYYKGNDPVTLHLRIKNIPSLMVKVFEFQPESYYIKEQKQLDGAVNLDGLVAAKEFNVDFKEPPARKFVKEFNFESIAEKKQGIFIIDFIGNGLSSRAIIRKGKLAFIEKQTTAGQLFTIIDEDAKVCKDGRVGMWIKGTFYQPDEKGRILVPFSTQRKEKVVLVNNDYAELVDVDLKAENWDFKCAYIYDYESFLMGNKAKILLQPRLFLNQQPMGLEVLQECSAILTTTNNDGIPSKTAFEKLKFSATEEVELEFPVPAKLNQINISVQVKITPLNQKEPQQYNSAETITVDGTINSQTFCNLYLRYSKNGYEVYLLGRNGEPKSGITVTLNFVHKYYTNSVSAYLQTDDQGRISLGKLEDVTSVTANIQTLGDITTNSKTWNINNYKSVNYPQKIRICEGEKIVLPLLHNELNKHKMYFIETLADGGVLKNCLNTLKIDKKRLIISDLKEGFYELYLKDVKTKIPITVIKGNYWSESGNYLLQKDCLIDIKTDVNNIVVTNVRTEVKENSDLVDVVIEAYADQPQLTRFHIFGCHFMEFNTNRTIDTLDAQISSVEGSETSLALKKSQFLNKRSLGDEYSYVLNRKSQSRYLGNTLEKPSILIKKTFVRDTQSREEQLADTQQFKSNAPADEERLSRNRRAEKGSAHRQRHGSYQQIDGFLNFLANPCLISSNQRLNEKGLIVIPNFPIKKYSFIKIIATNLTSNICELVPLEPSKIQTKDLTQKAREEGAVFSINRNSSGLLKGEKIKVKDLTSSEIQVIDSVTRLFDVEKNLALSGNNPNISTEFEKWDFLKGWDGLDFEEKLKKYDKFASHELHLFVYFKDREFFKKVALPFLQNKIEKTFIDYFLIGDNNIIKKYSGIEKFKDLNSLEQVLLIYGLHEIDPQHAKSLTYSLEQRDSLNKIELNVYKKYFDTALSVKQAEDFDAFGDPSFGGAGGMGGFSQMPAQNMMVQQPMMPAQYNLNMMSNMAPPPQMARMQQVAHQPRAPPQYQQQQQQQYQQYVQPGLYGVTLTTSSANAYMAQPQMMAEKQYQSYVNNPYGAMPGAVQTRTANFDEFDASEAEHFKSKRGAIRAGFQELEKTKEYCERNYYEKAHKNLSMPINKFWVDVAKHIIENGFTKPFLTSNFIYAHSSPTELIAVLSLISLPFKAGSHEYTSYEGRGVEIQAASDFIILTKAVTEVESEMSSEILVIQKFYDPRERYTESEEEAGLMIEKEIDQYIIDKVYGGTVIVTNSSGSNQQFQVLVEIPEGGIPLNSYGYTKSHTLQLNAYSTQTVEFFFYFPHIGKFKVNPPNVSKKGMVLARGKKLELEVKAEKVYASLETLNAVLTQGSQEDVLNFTRTKNIWNPKIFDFNAIYWLLSNKDFFLKFIQILRERKVFNDVVWQYGFYHKDVQTIQEYFASLPERNYPGDILYVNSSLLQVDKLRLLEYNPFINQRVHLLASEKNRILNVQFKEQYRNFVKYLCERSKLETEHYLALVYYLLLQDRVDEAIKFFAKIDREEVRKTTKYELQYDYFAAYIDFYIGYPNFSVAREVCQKYINYPVLAWRSLFIDVADQLAEFDGKEVMEEELPQKDKKKQNLINATKEETVNMEIHQTKLHITYQNVKEITLAFYRVDLEVLFSRNPFITQSKDEFSFIRPNEMKKIETVTSKDLEKLIYEIPEGLQKYNLYIELRTTNKTLSSTYFSTSLEVQIIESYGQVKVLDQNSKPLTKVYVKCFAQTNDGKTSFYKDGYTDLRGRFDYATLNSSDISTIKKFSIFIMSDDYGSLIKEVKAPNKLSKIDS